MWWGLNNVLINIQFCQKFKLSGFEPTMFWYHAPWSDGMDCWLGWQNPREKHATATEMNKNFKAIEDELSVVKKASWVGY